MVPMMLPAVVSGLSGLGPLSVAAAVNEGGTDPDPVAVVCIPNGFGEAEVHQLRAALGQHDVPRLQVTMNDAAAVRDGQRFGYGDSDLENFVQRHRAFAQAFRQSFAFEKLHHQVIGAILRSDVVEMADVGMVQRRNGAAFALHALL